MEELHPVVEMLMVYILYKEFDGYKGSTSCSKQRNTVGDIYFFIAFIEYTIGIFPSIPLICHWPSSPGTVLLKFG